MTDLTLIIKKLQQELKALREENAKLREYCEKQKESHRQKEESLKSSEKNYHKLYSLIRLMSDTMPDMLWAKDLNKQFLFVNESMCKNLLNASDTFEPIGKTDLYFAERERQSHPEDPNWHTFGELCMDSDAVTLKEMKQMQFDEFGNVKGEFLFLDVHKAPLINSKGELLGIVGSARDITSRREIVQALSKSENLFRSIWDNSLDGMRLTDKNGIVVKVNQAFCNLVNKRKDELENKSLAEVYKPELREHIHTSHIKNFRNNAIKPYIEKEFILWDNSKRWFAVSNAYLNPGSEDSLVLGIFRDITKNEKSKTALLDSEKNYRTLVENMQEGMLVVDNNDTILFVNPTFCDLTGYAKQDLIGKIGYQVLVTPSLHKLIIKKNKERLSGVREQYELEMIKKSGEKILFLMNAVPIKDSNNTVIGSFATCIDITKRKEVEEMLSASEAKFRHILNISPIPMALNDNKRKITYLNPSFIRTFGYTLKDIPTVDDWWSKAYPDTNYREWITQKLEEELERTKKTGYEFKPLEVVVKCKNGTGKTMLISSSIYPNQPGNDHVVACFDITDRKLAEIELEKYRKHLEDLVKDRTAELDKANISLRREIEKQKEYEMLLKKSLDKEKELSMMKSSFISTASHEFRTPLTSILSSSEMLQRYKKRWDEAKKDEHFDRIKRQVEYLTKLLDDVLLISKTESGKIEYKPSEVNIRQLIEDCLKESKSQMQESHKVVKKFSCKKNTFHVDSILMRFIISNLLSNAIKFSPNGGKIEIKANCNRKDFKLTISDQGIGLAAVEVNKIFQSFYRAANVGAISGTGLGLSIVNHAVELHGGKIMVKSELGKGTTIEVSIPLRKRKAVKSN